VTSQGTLACQLLALRLGSSITSPIRPHPYSLYVSAGRRNDGNPPPPWRMCSSDILSYAQFVSFAYFRGIHFCRVRFPTAPPPLIDRTVVPNPSIIRVPLFCLRPLVRRGVCATPSFEAVPAQLTARQAPRALSCLKTHPIRPCTTNVADLGAFILSEGYFVNFSLFPLSLIYS